MEVEIELKLSTQGQAGPIIVEKLLPQLDVMVEQSEFELSNSYFDTVNRDFRKNDMGLRIRGCQHEYEQTLKTAGKGVAGLQQRPEYNVSLGLHVKKAPQVPNLTLFPQQVWPTTFDLMALQSALFCQFSTQFTRSQFLLTWPDKTQVELVWDRGQVSASGRSSDINEIELELKSGSIDILFSLAKQIAGLMPVTVGLLSKAARGYRLIDKETSASDQKLSKLTTVKLTESDIQQSDVKGLTRYLAKTLKQWQNMSLAFPKEYPAVIQWGQELSALLILVEKIIEQLNQMQSHFVLQQSLHALPDLQRRLMPLQEGGVADGLSSAQQEQAKQGLFALVSDKDVINLQLELMQWLSTTYQDVSV